MGGPVTVRALRWRRTSTPLSSLCFLLKFFCFFWILILFFFSSVSRKEEKNNLINKNEENQEQSSPSSFEEGGGERASGGKKRWDKRALASLCVFCTSGGETKKKHLSPSEKRVPELKKNIVHEGTLDVSTSAPSSAFLSSSDDARACRRIADIGDASKRIGIAGEGSGANIASGNKTSHQVASV